MKTRIFIKKLYIIAGICHSKILKQVCYDLIKKEIEK